MVNTLNTLLSLVSGGLMIGLTTYNPGGEGGRVRADMGPGLGEVWWCSGSNVLRNGQVTSNNICNKLYLV